MQSVFAYLFISSLFSVSKVICITTDSFVFLRLRFLSWASPELKFWDGDIIVIGGYALR